MSRGGVGSDRTVPGHVHYTEPTLTPDDLDWLTAAAILAGQEHMTALHAHLVRIRNVLAWERFHIQLSERFGDAL